MYTRCMHFYKCLQRVCNQEKKCIQNADISKSVSKIQINNVCKKLATIKMSA